ncbi:MAG: DEAD/DEAH box helicase [Acidisphaera sp.]|nr:DEAD/DEAH box helicase [Acidisphaera sp.]
MSKRQPRALPDGPEGLLAASLTERAIAAGDSGLILIARSETRAARLHRAAAALVPGLPVLLLPAWDCLPYDRASPGRDIMGRRMATLHALSKGQATPCLVVAGIEAALQRLPPPASLWFLHLQAGGPIDPAGLEEQLLRLGYLRDERVDAPGEVALRGAVLDVFPPTDRLACRVRHEGGLIVELHRFDPVSQRSLDEITTLTLGPASELVLPETATAQHAPGLEHALPDFFPDLTTLFALLPRAGLVLDAEVPELAVERRAEIADAFKARLALYGAGAGGTTGEAGRQPPEPVRLYLDEAGWTAALAGRERVLLEPSPESPEGALPRFDTASDPEHAFVAFLLDQREAGRRVALAGTGRQARDLARRVARQLDVEAPAVADWPALRRLPAGSFAIMEAALDGGFIGPDATIVTAAEIRSTRARSASTRPSLPIGETGLRPGDAVIHLDRGLAALRGIEPIELGDARADCLRLEYHGQTRLLVPLDEIDRLWRYGAQAETVSLDRLDGEAWQNRREAVKKELAGTAQALLALARKREASAAPVLRPPRHAYERFANRFPHAPTQDQAAAIEAVLEDLAAGRPMDRLVCGDVGFGKTEVALRAAAVAAFAGKQVAVLAPTTVLVRQHLGTFRRRFAGTGLRIEGLSRLSTPAEARATRAGLADGSVRIAIGTHALAAKSVRFKDLALVVIDEEQRFGTRQKTQLRRLGAGVHVLTLTATPIPRTLQTALVGMQALSVIATPPARRQPIRTLQAPFDEALVQQALRREARRGGQSFVVCPRIEDIGALHDSLRRLVPELSLIEAHGAMPAERVDEAMVRFADGGADVLLSTDIVETGLDVPRANTMLVCNADRFGLAQLHQLRGRVGRGRARGSVYLLTDPARPPTPAASKRLDTLEALDRVGAGFAISARDMDLRGAGDLLGETQAGHVKLIGIALYQHLLEQALCIARGETPDEEWTPALSIAVPAYVPPDYVPDEALRIELFLRLGEVLRQDGAGALGAITEEIEDRFGPMPEPVETLLALVGLRARCRRLGVARLEVGPTAAAATFRGPAPSARAPLQASRERLLLHRQSRTPAQYLDTAERLLGLLARPRS